MKKVLTNILIVLIICAIGVICFLMYKEIKPLLDLRNAMNDLDVVVVENKENPLDRVIDFDKLEKVNSDIVGWLYIPDTSIDYPILIGGTDKEYLNKDMYGNYSSLGSIFALSGTNRELRNPKIVLYGHNMIYNAMFGELKKYYRNEDFLNKHDKFYVYTKDRTLELSIFSIFGCKWSDGMLSNYNDEMDENYLRVIDELVRRNMYADTSVLYNIEDYSRKQIFTLSTCKGEAGTSERLLVNGIVSNIKYIED